MSQETKQALDQERLYGQEEDDNSDVDKEIQQVATAQKGTVYVFIAHVMEKFAKNRMGQMVIEKSDRVLKVLEDTARWSLPQDDANGQLERPLPWIFFLSLIVCLRVCRIWLSVGYYMVGLRPVTPHSMVNYLKTQRCRLRAMRVRGLKSLRNREIEDTVMCNSYEKSKFMGKLGKLFSSAICKPGQHLEMSAGCLFSQDGKGVKDLSQRSKKRPRDDDANMTVDEMLDKYANEESDNDSDYIPNGDEDNDDDSGSSSNSSTSCDDDDANINNLTVNEMLDKYANVETDDDPDYIPNEDEDCNESNSSTSHISMSSAEKMEMKNEFKNIVKSIGSDQKYTHMLEESTETETEIEPNKSLVVTNSAEILANGETRYHSLLRHGHYTADSDIEQMHTPREMPNANGPVEAGKINEIPAMTKEVVPQSGKDTPTTTFNHLTVLQDEGITMKSTPGHETAASQKPSSPITTNPVPLVHPEGKKSSRTITTQTAIELDWTITLKTEITHNRHFTNLEKLKCSINLTPASSTEDIFYSPMGSLQDFHSIFHPAPLVKGASAEAPTSTPEEADLYESCTRETPVTIAAANRKKPINNSAHNKHYYNFNAKNRNRKRR